MSGISSNFINNFINLKEKGQLTNEKVKELAQKALSEGVNLDDLSKEIFKDGRIDKSEAKMIVMIGFYSDKSTSKAVKEHFIQPNDSKVEELFTKGFDLGQKAVTQYEKTSPWKAKLRDIGSSASFGYINSAEKEVKENNKGVMNKLDITLKHLETSCERTDCVREAIKRITGKDIGTDKSQEVTEKFLNEVTDVKDTSKEGWDAINASKYNKDGKNGQLQKILKDYEATSNDKNNGKALVVVGAHTYQFVGFNKDGNLLVKDPSDGNITKIIKKDNPSVTVYVQKVNGKGGDGGKSGRISADSTAVGFNAFSRSTSELSSDSYDQTGESKNIRKLLVLVGDKDQNNTSLFNAIKAGNLKGVQDILKAKGISISNQEIKAFITIMNTPVQNGNNKTTMLSELISLKNKKDGNSDRAKYLNGIEYSDISLKDYFTKTNPQAIFEVFKDMVAGKDGC